MKIQNYGDLRNFKYEKEELLTWKAYDFGPGRLIPWKSLYAKHPGMTNVSLDEGQSFFNSEIRQLSKKNYQDPKITVDSDNQPSLFVLKNGVAMTPSLLQILSFTWTLACMISKQ